QFVTLPTCVKPPSRNPLTYLVDEKFFLEQLELLLATQAGPLSLLLVDPDRFREVNERFGRGAGARVLVKLVTLMESHLRSTDCVARYREAQFAVLLPETGALAAAGVAQRLRMLILDAEMDEVWHHGVLTVSVGVASTGTAECHADHLLAAAERALHAAKTNGGDCVAVFRSLLSAPLSLPRVPGQRAEREPGRQEDWHD
ncbi:MAG: GGDEF domain-containing protein, partial [Armatimonadetes bacterium]|nr:GGDEF domain-containing protein [Armatimonadota bacterium]